MVVSFSRLIEGILVIHLNTIRSYCVSAIRREPK
nr:MAG TPA: hypothetical protein [Caudoviricetes sp.]DAS03514.1 MAG TPA: hypothetical protein [Caudoviricetes sp.]DAS48854.1 MAG TPA: hypothetical protein [Caudoviricetes sp.]